MKERLFVQCASSIPNRTNIMALFKLEWKVNSYTLFSSKITSLVLCLYIMSKWHFYFKYVI